MGPLTLWIPLRPRRRQAQPGPEGKAQGSGGSVLGAHPVPPAPSPRVGRSNGTCNQPPIDSNIPETRVLFLTVREPRDTGEKAGRVCCVGHTRARVGALSQAATGGQVWARDPPGGARADTKGTHPVGAVTRGPRGSCGPRAWPGGGTPTPLHTSRNWPDAAQAAPEDRAGRDALPDPVGALAVLPGARALPACQRGARKQTGAASESGDPGRGRG